MNKSVKTGNYAKFFIYLVVVVLLNVAGVTLFARIDLTSNRVYSLSKASRDVVASLSEPLTVKVFFSGNLPAPYNTIERYLHDILEEYALAGRKYFSYQFYAVSGDENKQSNRNQELARNYGIDPVQIQNIEQDEVKFQKAYMGMVILHGDIIEAIPTITSTEGLEYKITSTIQKMNSRISALLRLKDRIEVKLFLSSSLSAVGPYMNITGLGEFPARIGEIINKLNEKNYGKLSFTHLDPSLHPEYETDAERLNVLQMNWNEFADRTGRTIPADKGYAGIIIEHGKRNENIRIIDVFRLPIFGTQYKLVNVDDLEKAIQGGVESVIDINQEIGYLADHGTVSLEGAPQMFGAPHQEASSNLNRLMSERYSVTPVSLQDGEIPDDISSLIIAGPKEKFPDYELYQIDQFLMKGKSIAVFADMFSEVRPQGAQGMMGQFQQSYYMPVNTGLERLLSHYGVTVQKSIVLDENCFKQKVHQALGGGERPIYFAPIIKNELINKDAGYLQNIKGLVMLQASPISLNDQGIKDNGLAATKLFSSSARSWEMKDRIDLNPMMIIPPKEDEKFRSMPLAYIIEGAFPSYFADRPVPEKTREQQQDHANGDQEKAVKKEGLDMSKITAEGATIRKGKPGKLFIIGTSEILKDNVIDEEGSTPNAQFVMNVVDYLNGKEDIAVMRSKTQKFNPLRETSPAVKAAIKTANIAGIPVLVVVAGVIIWIRRTARKRQIQRIFST